MLRHAFRRLLWLIPSVLGISIVSFYALSFIRVAPGGASAEHEFARERFRDLPLFVNARPRDVRERAARAVDDLTSGSPGRDRAERGRGELVRLGGAALPYVLPRLDSLEPEARRQLALSLAPIAQRMGLEHRGEPTDPDRAVLFWTRFWETRHLEFHLSTVRSAVRRYARYGSDARLEDLRSLDTFALPALVDALEPPAEDRAELARARRLVELLADLTGRDDRIAREADAAAARACVDRWTRWWLVYRSDYVPLVGASRAAAFALETQYGKWVLEAVTMRLGRAASGRPILDEVLRRAPVTLTIVLLAVALAYAAAAVLGAVVAVRRNTVWARGACAVALLAHLATPAVLGTLALGLWWRADAHGGGKLLVASAVCALVLLADPLRHKRAALASVLVRDYVRAAAARGGGAWRVVFVHALRGALMPLLTRATLEVPMACTAAFVVEHLLQLQGLGSATIEAVRTGDAPWLMALTVAASVWAVVALVLTDVAYALADPRLRQVVMRLRRRRA